MMKYCMSWIFIFVFIHVDVSEARRKKAERKYDEASLINSLMTNYNKLVRPHRRNNSTHVTFGMSLQDVVYVREDTMEATVNFLTWLNFKWSDHRLRWNRTLYNTDIIRLPPQSIWTPDVRLYNSLDPRPDLDWGVKSVVYHDGSIMTVVPVQLPVHCGRPRDPHATWDCNLKFGSWTYNGDEVDLDLDLNEADVTTYNNRVWEVTGNKAQRNRITYECCPEPYIDLTYSIRLLRH